MLEVLQHFYMLPLFTSTFLSLKSIRYQWPVPYRLFSALLICISFVELFALLWAYLPRMISGWPYTSENVWFYNILIVPQYILYACVYYWILRSIVLKVSIVAMGLIYVLFAVFNALRLQPINMIHSNTMIMASGMVIFMTIAYFEQLWKEKIDITAEPFAWISAGALLFHVACVPYMLGLNYLNRTSMPLAISTFYVFLFSNIVMYTLYLKAFLCNPTHPKR